MQPASYKSFRIQVAAGWTATEKSDDTSEFLQIVPARHDAEFRLTTFEVSHISAERWVEAVAEVSRIKHRPVLIATFGSLVGYEVPFVSDDLWLRGWALECSGVPLDVTYRCPIEMRGVDDGDIDAMLKSLQFEPTVP